MRSRSSQGPRGREESPILADSQATRWDSVQNGFALLRKQQLQHVPQLSSDDHLVGGWTETIAAPRPVHRGKPQRRKHKYAQQQKDAWVKQKNALKAMHLLQHSRRFDIVPMTSGSPGKKRVRSTSAFDVELMDRMERNIATLPLAFLATTTHRDCALAQALSLLTAPLLNFQMAVLRRRFSAWKAAAASTQHESQKEKAIGVLLLAHALNDLVQARLNIFLMTWARKHATRYNPVRIRQRNNATRCIVRFFRQYVASRQITHNALAIAAEQFVTKRRTIQCFIQYERKRKRALDAVRQRKAAAMHAYYCVRVIQRLFRSYKHCSEVLHRLSLSRQVRSIQFAYKYYYMSRSQHERFCRRLILQLRDGFFQQIPVQFWLDHQLGATTFAGRYVALKAVTDAISVWWQKVRDRRKLFERFKARRAIMDWEILINKSAAKIQRTWCQFKVFVAYNRDRRIAAAKVIKRLWKGYQIRMMLVERVLRTRARRNHAATVLNQWTKVQLYHFKRIRCKLQIVLAWRWKKTQKRIKVRQHMAYLARQQLLMSTYHFKVGRLQLAWRRRHGRFSYHVLLLTQNTIRREKIWQSLASQTICKYCYVLIILPGRTRRKVRHDYAARTLQKWTIHQIFLMRLRDRIERKRALRTRATTKLQYWLRHAVFMKVLQAKFVKRKALLEELRRRNFAASTIQDWHRRCIAFYNLPMRKMARLQLARKKKLAAIKQQEDMLNAKVLKIQRLYKAHFFRCTIFKLMESRKRRLLEARAASSIQLAWKAHCLRAEVMNRIGQKKRQREEEEHRIKLRRHAGKITRAWQKTKERTALEARFKLRKRMLSVMRALHEHTRMADEDRNARILIYEHQHNETQQLMDERIAGAWKQGSDAYGRNYYFNYVTGESTWSPPANWVSKPAEDWIRNVDERGVVYYYNQRTAMSSWLPPCAKCGNIGERQCAQCSEAYCKDCYDNVHDDPNNPDFQSHTWQGVELEKDELEPGEQHCIYCTKRKAVYMCYGCLDPYCKQCFDQTHSTAALQGHKHISYRRAKQGWFPVKPRKESERIYYVNGTTGQTTYEKPEELMSSQELEYYQRYVEYKTASNDLVDRVEKLQYELEEVKYQRDKMWHKIHVEGMGPRQSSAAATLAKKIEELDGQQSQQWFKKSNSDYKKVLLAPSSRMRVTPQVKQLDKILNQSGTGKVEHDQQPS